MENDVLKNKIAPWQEKGRWYHLKWDYSKVGAIQKIIKSETDPELYANIVDVTTIDSARSWAIYINADWGYLVDVKFRHDSKIGLPTSETSQTGTIRYAAAGNYGVAVGPYAATSGILDIWFFINKV